GAPIPLTGASPLPLDWRPQASADFDHDGHADLVWRNLATRALQIWTLNGTTRVGTLVPSPDHAADDNWQLAAAEDLNADGNVDLLWYNVSSGRIVEWLLDGNAVRLAGRFTNPPNAGDANWKVVAAADYGVGPGGTLFTGDLLWRNASSGRLVLWYLDNAGNRTAGAFTTPDAPANPTGWNVVGPR